MTGFFVRIQRGGKWQSLDIAELTNDELDAFALQCPDDGWKWGTALAKWIRDNLQVQP